MPHNHAFKGIHMAKSKRRRATAVVLNPDRDHVLLVRERGKSIYSLPGGGFRGKESTVVAAAREVGEETRLKIKSVTRVLDYEGQSQSHRVCIIEAGNTEIKLRDRELDYAFWWDGRDKTQKLLASTAGILSHKNIGFLPRPLIGPLWQRVLIKPLRILRLSR